MEIQRKIPETTRDRVLAMLVTAMGPKVREYLHDSNVIELMLNPDGHLWIDILGVGKKDTGCVVDSKMAEQIIFLVADSMKTPCNRDNPILSGELPGDGSRFEGLLPPVCDAPTFSIRKKALKIFTLDEYVEQKVITLEQRLKIVQGVQNKKNILVVGGTSSGKTTLVNAILTEIARTKSRVIIIEDTRELQCSAENKVQLHTRESPIEAHSVTMDRLLKSTLRLAPDRIVVGEVRGKEALTLLDAWNTGHPGGCATIHANSARDGLERLEQLIQRVVQTPQQKTIARAVNLVLYIEKCSGGRRLKEIMEVVDFKNGEYILNPL